MQLVSFVVLGLFLFCSLGFWGDSIVPISKTTFSRSMKTPIDEMKQVKIITLGASHNMAIEQQMFEEPMLHLWSYSQNPEQSILILKLLQERLQQNEIILIPMSIGSLMQRNSIGEWFVSEMIPLAPFDVFVQTFPQATDHYARGWARYIARDDNWVGPIKKLVGFPKKEKKDYVFPDEYNPFKVDRAKGHLKEASKDINSIAKNLERFNSLAALSQEMNSCVLFYESPVSYYYTEAMASYQPEMKQWKTRLREFIHKNRDRYCVDFIENIWPESYAKDPEYYWDQDHLNKKGSKLFTAMIQDKITESMKRANNVTIAGVNQP